MVANKNHEFQLKKIITKIGNILKKFLYYMKMSSEFFSNVSTAFCSDLKYPKLAWFYQKNEWASMKMLYFVNWRNAAQLNSANIFLSKSIFYVKNQPTFSISFFHWKISILTIFCSKKKSNFNFKTYLLLGPILDRAKLHCK